MSLSAFSESPHCLVAAIARLTFNSPWPVLSNLRHVLRTPHNMFLAGCAVTTLQNHVEREAHANLG